MSARVKRQFFRSHHQKSLMLRAGALHFSSCPAHVSSINTRSSRWLHLDARRFIFLCMSVYLYGVVEIRGFQTEKCTERYETIRQPQARLGTSTLWVFHLPSRLLALCGDSLRQVCCIFLPRAPMGEIEQAVCIERRCKRQLKYCQPNSFPQPSTNPPFQA